MLWTALGVLRYSVTGAALGVMGFDIDWVWIRAGVAAGGVLTLTLMTRRLRAERRDRARLVLTLADALRQPPGAEPVPAPRAR